MKQEESGSGQVLKTSVVMQLRAFVAREEELEAIVAEMRQLAADGGLLLTRSEVANERVVERTAEQLAALKWFSEATLELSGVGDLEDVSAPTRARVEILRQRCLRWSFPASVADGPRRPDVAWALAEARDLLECLDGSEIIAGNEIEPAGDSTDGYLEEPEGLSPRAADRKV